MPKPLNDYVLNGKTVTLSNRLDPEFAEPMAEIANDRDISRNIGAHGFPYPYTVADAEYFFDLNREEGRNFFAIDFLIFADDKLVGVTGLKDINRTDLNAHVGYWIGKRYWNRGYASEALSLMIEFCRDEIGLARLHTRVLEYNLASLRVLIKNGFTVEGYERNAFRMDNTFYSLFVMGLLL